MSDCRVSVTLSSLMRLCIGSSIFLHQSFTPFSVVERNVTGNYFNASLHQAKVTQQINTLAIKLQFYCSQWQLMYVCVCVFSVILLLSRGNVTADPVLDRNFRYGI